MKYQKISNLDHPRLQIIWYYLFSSAHEKVKADCGKYQNGSTMCLHPADCKRAIARGGVCGKLSKKEIQLILDEHNKYRQKVSDGTYSCQVSIWNDGSKSNDAYILILTNLNIVDNYWEKS